MILVGEKRPIYFAMVLFLSIFLIHFVAHADEAENHRLFENITSLNVEGVKQSIKNKADPNSVWRKYKRPMTAFEVLGSSMLVNRGDKERPQKVYEIAQVLFKNGAKLSSLDTTILFFSISEGNIKLVGLLIDHGASPTKRLEGYTPAELALKYGQQETYKYLLTRGAVPVDEKEVAQISFIEAARDGELAKMRNALLAGARVNKKGPDGSTALINIVRDPAYQESSVMSVIWLLQNGADPNIKGESRIQDVDGIPLHIAIVMNYLTMNKQMKNSREYAEIVVNSLIQHGAKISAMDSKGRTPLHLAAKFDNVFGAAILIKNNARIMARDNQGRTPLDYAESSEMIRLLKKHGAVEH